MDCELASRSYDQGGGLERSLGRNSALSLQEVSTRPLIDNFSERISSLETRASRGGTLYPPKPEPLTTIGTLFNGL